MAREVKNAHYWRLALVSYDVNPVSWQNTTKKYRVSYTRVVRPSSSFKMSESDSSYDSDDSECNLSLATSTLALLKSKTMEI